MCLLPGEEGSRGWAGGGERRPSRCTGRLCSPRPRPYDVSRNHRLPGMILRLPLLPLWQLGHMREMQLPCTEQGPPNTCTVASAATGALLEQKAALSAQGGREGGGDQWGAGLTGTAPFLPPSLPHRCHQTVVCDEGQGQQRQRFRGQSRDSERERERGQWLQPLLLWALVAPRPRGPVLTPFSCRRQPGTQCCRG